jgi:hypothetical protein
VQVAREPRAHEYAGKLPGRIVIREDDLLSDLGSLDLAHDASIGEEDGEPEGRSLSRSGKRRLLLV